MTELPFALPESDPAAVGSDSGSAEGVPSPDSGRPQPDDPAALHLVDALYTRVREACDQDSALTGAELDEHAHRIADTLLSKARARR